MRLKTDEKRRTFLNAALALFEEVGYERASMSAIAARAGGSKATLYGYFETKEKLFASAMTDALEDYAKTFIVELRPERDLASVLYDFGVAYLKFMLSEPLLAIKRVTLGDSSLVQLGPELYRLGPMRAWTAVADFFAHKMTTGELRTAPPFRVAIHFKGLLEAGMVEPALQGVPPHFGIEETALQARDVFLRYYAG